MNKSHAFGILTAIGLAGAAIAQEPATPPSSDPRQTEEESAGRVTPGETPTKGAARDAKDLDRARDANEARPSTSQTEGTAADRTAPGETATTSDRTARSPAASGGKELVGASVVTKANTPLGEVTDVVFDAKQQPAFVIISAAGESAAVPYAAASSMMSGDKVVIDQSRLQSAPKVRQGEWRDQSSTKWQADAKRYWDKTSG